MKTNFLITSVFALLVTFSFYSCIKEPVEPPIIIDPVYPVYETKWESVEMISNFGMWKPQWLPVAGPDTLNLLSTDLEKSRPRRGYYQYFPYYSREPKPRVGKEGLFIQSDNLLVFIDAKSSASDPDTLAKVAYELIGDTLIIYGESVSMKFKKVKVAE